MAVARRSLLRIGFVAGPSDRLRNQAFGLLAAVRNWNVSAGELWGCRRRG